MSSPHISRPHMLIMAGIPGSGKSAFGAQFSATFGAPIVSDAPLWDLDEIPSVAAQEAVTAYQLDQLLLTKATIIIDNATSTRKARADLIRKAKKAGYTPLVVWVQTDEQTARKRAMRRTKSNPQPYSAEDFTRSVSHFTAPKSPEPIVVISGKHTYATQAKTVLTALAGNREAKERRTALQKPKRRGHISVR